MKIREVEQITGITKVNIRYYESQGLITPRREENGYRDYTQEDATQLLRIRLLRSLDIPIDTIQSLSSGETRLDSVLTRRMEQFPQEHERLERVENVMGKMISGGAEFETLDATAYLGLLDSDTLRQDVAKVYNLPWRRYWARCFDFAFYAMTLDLLLKLSVNTLLLNLLTLIAMLLVEPLLLHLFGTTPGKAMFGIRVTDPDEGRLSYGDALERIWLVMWEGEALRIPLVTLYFQYKSYAAAEEGRALPWEQSSELFFSDDGTWRYGLFAAAMVAVLVAEILIWTAGG